MNGLKGVRHTGGGPLHVALGVAASGARGATLGGRVGGVRPAFGVVLERTRPTGRAVFRQGIAMSHVSIPLAHTSIDKHRQASGSEPVVTAGPLGPIERRVPADVSV